MTSANMSAYSNGVGGPIARRGFIAREAVSSIGVYDAKGCFDPKEGNAPTIPYLTG
jgi:hypothetical protein